MHVRLRALALLIGLALGLGPLAPAVFAEEKASELENLKKQMLQMEEQFRQLQRQIEKLERQAAPPGAAGRPQAADPALQKKLHEVESKADAALAATKKTFPSQFNPTLTLGIDTIGSHKSTAQRFNLGDGPQANTGINNARPGGADFNLRSVELFLQAHVDPFVRAYGVINAAADLANNDEAALAVEEAAIVTTSLPYNLQVRGGRFFANFGTLAHRHDPELPFVDRPPSLDLFIGGEGQTNGVEVSWLAPTPFYLRFTGAVGNKLGGDTAEVFANGTSRPLRGLTYLGRVQAYFDLTDDHNVELGASIAETPNVDDDVASGKFERRLVGLDLKYRWYPLGRGLRQNVTLAGELLYDVGEVVPGGGRRLDVFGNLARQGAWGGYAYAEYRLSKQWRPGFRFDYFQDLTEPQLVTSLNGSFGSTPNLTGNRTDNRTWSPYLTWMPSEFQRVRLQYNRSDRGNANDAHEFFLQWTVFLGSHAHGFLERD